MKLTISTSSILVFHGFFAFAIGNVFVINRNRPSGLNQWWWSRDSFKVPTSICNRTSTGSEICGSFYATNGDGSCSCSCPRDRATFVFAEDGWTCLENDKIRNLQGKSVIAYQINKFTEEEVFTKVKLKFFIGVSFCYLNAWRSCDKSFSKLV